MMAQTLIKIKDKSGVWYIPPKIIDYEVQYCKLWSSDTGRSMTGENKGTLIGIFPKITLQLGGLSNDEMSKFLQVVDQAKADVQYYDTENKMLKTNSFYFGDVQSQLKRANNMTYKAISVSIIANKKR